MVARARAYLIDKRIALGEPSEELRDAHSGPSRSLKPRFRSPVPPSAPFSPLADAREGREKLERKSL